MWHDDAQWNQQVRARLRQVWHYFCVVRRGAGVIDGGALHKHAMGAAGIGREAQDFVDPMVVRLGPGDAARLAWRLLKVFLGWCSEQPAYADLLPAKNPAKTTRSRKALGKAGVKQDALMREQ